MRILILSLIALVAVGAWAGEVTSPAAAAGVKLLQEITRLGPSLDRVDKLLALDEPQQSARSVLTRDLGAARGFIDIGNSACGAKASADLNWYWDPLVQSCTIDRPEVGRALINQVLADPKMGYRSRSWIIAKLMRSGGSGLSLSWLDPEPLLRLCGELSQDQTPVFNVTYTAITITSPVISETTTFTGPLTAALILQAYFCEPFPAGWDTMVETSAANLTERDQIPSLLVAAMTRAETKAHLITGSTNAVEHWRDYGFGPRQRQALATIVTGSRRADLAHLHHLMRLARAELKHQPDPDPELARTLLAGIHTMWTDGLILKHIGARRTKEVEKAAPIADLPARLTAKSADEWLRVVLPIIHEEVRGRSRSGFTLVDLDAMADELGAAR